VSRGRSKGILPTDRSGLGGGRASGDSGHAACLAMPGVSRWADGPISSTVAGREGHLMLLSFRQLSRPSSMQPSFTELSLIRPNRVIRAKADSLPPSVGRKSREEIDTRLVVRVFFFALSARTHPSMFNVQRLLINDHLATPYMPDPAFRSSTCVSYLSSIVNRAFSL
jgi:hypothetical protein